MQTTWTQKWKKILIWLSGYLNFVAFALVGGYTIVKSEDEELKKTAKQAFVVTLIFTALSAFFSLFNYCGDLFSDRYAYNSDAYKFYQTGNIVVNVARIVTYAVFVILTLVKKEEN